MVVANEMDQFIEDAGIDVDLELSVTLIAEMSRRNPEKGSEEHAEMVNLGKHILKKTNGTGEVNLSPFAGIIIGENPMVALWDALNKCDLLPSVPED